MTAIRLDIQALRGIAVLMVVLFHVDFGGVSAGYLGVDIFFVISGYLITLLIAEGIGRGDFRLGEFYFRRAKRLLPAAYVTILVTALMAPWFLSEREMRDFALQVVGAVSFTANFVLWRQSGYFEGASELKPLLHTWSLSLEEQFYMFLPAALVLLPRRLWMRGVLLALLLSLGLCAVGALWKPTATFYLLPTRAWELLIGSAGALLVWTRRSAGDPVAAAVPVKVLFYPALAALLLLPMWPLGGTHPGIGALTICLATLVIVLRRHEGLERTLLVRWLARVGDISYSLYLVHWPIVALLKNTWVGPGVELPVDARVAAGLLAFATAYLLYRFVERPTHRARLQFTRRRFAGVVFSSFVLMLVAPSEILASKQSTNFDEVRRVNFGLHEVCEYTAPFAPRPECSSGSQPRFLVWGDSYAMHLVPGLAHQLAARGEGVIQATRSVCGPILDLSPQRLRHAEHGPVHDRAWAERCIEFSQSVFEFAAGSRSIEVVVLSSPLSQYIDATNWLHVARSDAGTVDAAPSVSSTAVAIERTVRRLQAVGKRVVVVAPPPRAKFDVGACLERQATGLVSLGTGRDCSIPADSYRSGYQRELELLDSIERAGVPVLRFDPFLCDAKVCKTSIDSTMVYRDEGHLSYEGSKLLAARMNWVGMIQQLAR